MSDVYQCKACNPPCLLVAQDDDIPDACPFDRPSFKTEWRQIQ